MTDKTWKQAERRIAAMLGGVRVPITGRSRGSAPDIAHSTYSIEVKQRKTVPAWLFKEAFEQADMSNSSGQTPLVVVEYAPGRGRKSERFVVLRLDDFIELTSGEEV